MVAAIPQTYIIEEASEIELRGGLFYVTDRLETGQVIVRVFRPSTYFRQVAGLVGASRDYRISGAEVIPLRDEVERRA